MFKEGDKKRYMDILASLPLLFFFCFCSPLFQWHDEKLLWGGEQEEVRNLDVNQNLNPNVAF